MTRIRIQKSRPGRHEGAPGHRPEIPLGQATRELIPPRREPDRSVRRLMYMLKKRTVKAYLIAIFLIWCYTIAGIFFASVVYPDSLTRDGSDAPRTLNLIDVRK